MHAPDSTALCQHAACDTMDVFEEEKKTPNEYKKNCAQLTHPPNLIVNKIHRGVK